PTEGPSDRGGATLNSRTHCLIFLDRLRRPDPLVTQLTLGRVFSPALIALALDGVEAPVARGTRPGLGRQSRGPPRSSGHRPELLAPRLDPRRLSRWSRHCRKNEPRAAEGWRARPRRTHLPRPIRRGTPPLGSVPPAA